MYCKCKKPQAVKSYVGKDTFEVCSKSKGGCGEEIATHEVHVREHKEYSTEWKVLPLIPIINPHVPQGWSKLIDLDMEDSEIGVDFTDDDIPFMKVTHDRTPFIDSMFKSGLITQKEYLGLLDIK